ncbi:MAG: RNA polymerase sigma factor (sigma-70 family) [Planctomycetota bacterium]|jgi:RNA polymerase sigma factor (sigma-70 family)
MNSGSNGASEEASDGDSVDSQLTCLTLIRGAAAGSSDDRDLFARRYLPVARAYMNSAWRSPSKKAHVEDAVQEVFIQCFRAGGALEGYDPAQPGGFRSFLFGVMRNVVRRYEQQFARGTNHILNQQSALLNAQPSDDEAHSVAFDRAWAIGMIGMARELMEQRALILGHDARQRLEMLRLRFDDNLPIREIAAALGLEPEAVHQHYRRARREFKACLKDVIGEHALEGTEDLDLECERLLTLLS